MSSIFGFVDPPSSSALHSLVMQHQKFRRSFKLAAEEGMENVDPFAVIGAGRARSGPQLICFLNQPCCRIVNVHLRGYGEVGSVRVCVGDNRMLYLGTYKVQ